MKKLYGNTRGLKASQLRKLEKLYRRRIPPQFPVTTDLVREISHLTSDIRRQVGLLITRSGRIDYVIIGDRQGIVIPDISHYRIAPGRLRGLRCVHTTFKAEGLSQDDLTDLALLRLDLMGVVTLTDGIEPKAVHMGHLLPTDQNGEGFETLPPRKPFDLDIGCLELIRSLESEMGHLKQAQAADGAERALLVSVTTRSRTEAEDSLEELKELAESSGIQVLGTVLQQRRKVDPRFLLGTGRLRNLIIETLRKGATLLIFDRELTPAQIRSITDLIDLKIIDRTQLILDIFTQRAQTREGKLQVELAQLRYLLPRLVTKNTAMSRLTGGIGGRGPGETKLEINRRRVRERIGRLETALAHVSRHRNQQRAKRDKRKLPIISIIGYTNAGKSTLLNTLTHSRVLAEERMFATLDPSSRRLRFPRDIEVIITDTVGFIRDLPRDLISAFRATLEELTHADLLLHVIDIHNPRFEDQIESVETILTELDLQHIPQIRVLNKMDLVDPEEATALARRFDGVLISATTSRTLTGLVTHLARAIERIRSTPSDADKDDVVANPKVA